MTMVTRIGELRSEEAFRPWLRMVAVNRARTAGRRRRTCAEAIDCLSRAPAESRGEGPAADHAECEEGRALLSLARRLPEHYREPLLLRCLNDLSYRQIGEILTLPETTIETRIARARRMLRDLRARTQNEV